MITNRQFQPAADGWYHVVPMGEYTTPDKGRVQVVDQAALDAIVRNFEAERQLRNFTGLLVDFEHFSLNPNKPSEAAGWITALEVRSDGVYAKIDWSGAGEKAINDGRYRLISPVFSESEPLGGNRIRPLRLESAGLTNAPNMRGMVPLANRAAGHARPATPERCLPMRAAAFTALCNRVQSELGCGFDRAWNLSREIWPHVYSTAFDIEDTVLPRFSRQSRAADERQGLAIAQACNLANRAGTFADYFHQGTRATPLLLNRDAAENPGVRDDHWREALRRAPDVIAAIEGACHCAADRGRSMLFRGDWNQNIALVFAESIKSLMQANGWTVQEASDFLQQTEPVLWGAGVMNYRVTDNQGLKS